MKTKESCCYTRTYSDIEGLQLAHTLTYSASRTETGIVLELKMEMGTSGCVSRVLCTQTGFCRAMALMQYLCENGIGPGQWLDVLADHQLEFRPLGMQKTAQFVSFADFVAPNLLHNTELTQRV